MPAFQTGSGYRFFSHGRENVGVVPFSGDLSLPKEFLNGQPDIARDSTQQ
jgi:hypothetical protein